MPADLHAAAFGDRPDLAVRAVPTDPRERWLAAVVLGAQGWYARAATLLDELRRHPDPVLAALAAATLASHRRQLGGHAEARRHDAAGLASLLRVGDARSDAPRGRADENRPGSSFGRTGEARADVLLGLAADAVGLGRPGAARRLVAAVPADAGWRAAIRTGWVRAETELVAGRPGDAVRHAEPAAELAAWSGSVRHRVKSALVLGAALGANGDRTRAVALVSPALDDAADLGLLTLVWPAAMILTELVPTDADRFRRCAALALRSVVHRTDPVGRRLAERSPWVPRLTGPTG
ncbi:hypothetical protein JT362_34100 [Actinophytocola sp. S1-96]|uniref:HEAT repeat domain-containing protein n=1 Tax=Actinophytocola gossypii TaxID=2812003 RepID=A0ABT2JJV2_9PSEU|nr:hypothetical protein [Actinophytocola gossypii]